MVITSGARRIRSSSENRCKALSVSFQTVQVSSSDSSCTERYDRVVVGARSRLRFLVQKTKKKQETKKPKNRRLDFDFCFFWTPKQCRSLEFLTFWTGFWLFLAEFLYGKSTHLDFSITFATGTRFQWFLHRLKAEIVSFRTVQKLSKTDPCTESYDQIRVDTFSGSIKIIKNI